MQFVGDIAAFTGPTRRSRIQELAPGALGEVEGEGCGLISKTEEEKHFIHRAPVSQEQEAGGLEALHFHGWLVGVRHGGSLLPQPDEVAVKLAKDSMPFVFEGKGQIKFVPEKGRLGLRIWRKGLGMKMSELLAPAEA
jgi:hypothetical protein